MKNYKVVWSSQFKKDYKLAMKRNLKIELLDNIILALARGEVLPKENRDHELTGNRKGYRECHIAPDWLLIYKIYNDTLPWFWQTQAHTATYLNDLIRNVTKKCVLFSQGTHFLILSFAFPRSYSV